MKCRHTRHKGTTMVEVLVVMFLVTTVLGLVAGISRQLMLAERASRASLFQWPAFAELATRFRQDIHAANEILVGNEAGASVLRIHLDKGNWAVYRARFGNVERIEDEKATPLAREAFRIPGGSHVEWSMKDDEENVVVMWITFAEDSTFLPSEGARVPIEATIGAQLRDAPTSIEA